MSRMTIRMFLVQAKRALQRAERDAKPLSFVIGNESADLDSITSALVYGYIKSSELDARRSNSFVIPVTNIPAADLRLRPELTALLRHAGVKPTDLITLDDLAPVRHNLPADRTNWTLVDHNAFQGDLGKAYADRVVGVIDHHVDEGAVRPDAEPRIIEKSGSCSSLVVNFCRDAWDAVSSAASSVGAANGQDNVAIDDFAYTSTWDAQVAKLALGSILIDTVNLTDENKVTRHDQKAVKYLEARINSSPKIGKDYDRDAFFKEIDRAKSDLDDLSVEDILRKDYKQWTEGDLTLGTSACVQPIEYLQGRTEDLLAEVEKYSQSRGAQLFAVMTAHNRSGTFQRQLLLLSTDGSKASEAAEKFASDHTRDLQLETSGTPIDQRGHAPAFLHLWEQRNLAASRKQVAPMLRDAMTSIG